MPYLVHLYIAVAHLKSIYATSGSKPKKTVAQAQNSMLSDLMNKLSDREREVDELRKENRCVEMFLVNVKIVFLRVSSLPSPTPPFSSLYFLSTFTH